MSDLHDPELRQQLGRLSGPYPDDNAAFAAWQRRVGQVRRRRAVALTTGGAMSLLVGLVAVAAMQGPNRHSVVPQRASETTADVTTIVTTTHDKPSTTQSTEATTTTTTTALAPETSPITEPIVEASMPPADTAVAGGEAPAATTHKSSGTTTPAAAPTPTTATTDPDSHNGSTTFTSDGGSITVRESHDKLIVVDITAADGYHSHQTDHFDHQVGVLFTSANHNWEVTVKLDHGRITSETHEKSGGSHGESGPPGTYGGDWGGGD